MLLALTCLAGKTGSQLSSACSEKHFGHLVVGHVKSPTPAPLVDASLQDSRHLFATILFFSSCFRAVPGANGPNPICPCASFGYGFRRQPFYENFTKFLQWLEKSELPEELREQAQSASL